MRVSSQFVRLTYNKLTLCLDVGRVLLFVRSQYGMLDDGARFHLLSHLIRETVNIGKSMLATSLVSRDDTLDPNYNLKDAGSIQNLIQRDRVLAAVCALLYKMFCWQYALHMHFLWGECNAIKREFNQE